MAKKLCLAREKIPDIVLLDMLLPKLGGREVIRALRDDAPTAHIPVLVFSSLPQAPELKLTDEGAQATLKIAVGGAPGNGRERTDSVD
jgi:CheY-like chemotaxis protein